MAKGSGEGPSGGPAAPGPSLEATIVLATLNERENLPALLDGIERAANFPHRLLFIDDGSRDGTQDFVRQLATTRSDVTYIFNPAPQTTLRAHAQGIRASKTPFVIIMDSDLQHPTSILPALYERLRDGADVVVGSRYLKSGSTGNRTAFRGLISRVAEMMGRLSSRNARKLSDPLSGLFGLRRDRFPRDGPAYTGYKMLLFILAANGPLRIDEVPYGFREREAGKSKVVGGVRFLWVFLREVLLAKRVEVHRPRSTPR